MIQAKICAGKYILLGMPWTENWIRHENRSRKSLLMTAWRELPNRARIEVNLYEGDAPEMEEAKREFRSIQDRRVNEVEQIFRDHGLVIDRPSK